MNTISKNIIIEDLIEQKPGAIKFLMDKGIRCIACGEPIWGTLEDAAKEKGFSDDEIAALEIEINKL